MREMDGDAVIRLSQGYIAQEKEQTISELRWLADSYELAQEQRIAAGERLRSLCRLSGEAVGAREADRMLAAARAGHDTAASRILSRAYRRHWEQERDYAAAMTQALRTHPAWPWLQSVKGIGPTLACRLLARLDISKASAPSSFWSFCGLSTVPAQRFVCTVCGTRTERLANAPAPADHRTSGTCMGVWRRDESAQLRCAPRATRGRSRSYDAEAKRICYLIGCSFLKCGSPYREIYDRERHRLAHDQPDWPDLRRHYAALRKMEKRFLLELWKEWRAASMS